MDHSILDCDHNLYTYSQEIFPYNNIPQQEYTFSTTELTNNLFSSINDTSNNTEIILQLDFNKKQDIATAIGILSVSGVYLYKLQGPNHHSDLLDTWINTGEISVNTANSQTEDDCSSDDELDIVNYLPHTISKVHEYEIREPTKEEKEFYNKLENAKNNLILRAAIKKINEIIKYKKLKKILRGEEKEFIKDKIIHCRLSRLNVDYSIIDERRIAFEETTGSKFMTYSDIISDSEAIEFLLKWFYSKHPVAVEN